MADNNKRINVEFSDNGSIQRLKQIYNQAFIPPGSSSLYQSAQSQFGNPALAQQQRNYFGPQGAVPVQNLQMQQSIEAAKSTFREISDAFKRLDSIQSKYQSDYTRYTERKGNLSSQYFTDNPEAKRKEQEKLRAELNRLDNVEGSLVGEEQRILSGTGYRKRSTFESGASKEIAKAEKEYQKLLQQQEKTNSILTAWQTQDRKQAVEQVKAIEKNANSTKEELEAAKIFRESEEPERLQRKQALVQGGLGIGLALLQGGGQYLINQSAFERNLRMQTNSYDALGAYGENSGNNNKLGWQTAGSVVGIAGGAALSAAGIGASAGSVIPGLGTIIGGAAGLIIGGVIGSLTSDNIKSKYEQAVRSMKARDDFYQTTNRYRGLTGSDAQSGDRHALEAMGFSVKDIVELQISLARSAGTSKGGLRNSTLALEYERGWGIDRGVTSDILNQGRSNRSTDRDIQNIIGGVFEKGKDIFKGDRTFLGEFLQTKFLPLQRELLRNQTSVGTGTTMDVLNRFNSLGGQFDAMHQNSSGLISQINSSMINPASDSANAISFYSLRNTNPGMGMFDTLKERQRGLSSPTYLKAMMEMVQEMGGGEDIQKMNMAGLFGLDGNLDAVDTLYKNRKKITSGTISQSELRSMTSARGAAVANTTSEQQVFAEQQNLIIENFTKAGKVMADYLEKRIAQMEDEYSNPKITFTVDGKIINNAMTVYGTAPAAKNTTQSNSKKDIKSGDTEKYKYAGGGMSGITNIFK